jgi:branched-chain amino acid transport system ATP-binding protein
MQEGQLFWEGRLLIPHPEQMVKHGISYVPQGRQIFGSLSVEENLEMGGYPLQKKSELKDRIDLVYQNLPILKERRKFTAGLLSGGQQQMLALARGLMMQPKVLLLDEPTLGLSPRMVKEIFEQVQHIHKTFKTSILVVEHNIKSLSNLVDRIYVLEQGQVIAHGSPQELNEQEIWSRIFLGETVKS